MIDTNISKQISAVKTTLDGVVVTPNTQQTHYADNIYPLEFLLTDQIKEKFYKNTFPIVYTNSNGELFMQPVQHIITPMSNTHVKWFCIGDDFKPSHDHNYPVAKVKSSGYFMKLSIDGNRHNPSDCDFTIEYIQNISSIETIHVQNNETNNISDIIMVKPFSLYSQSELIKNIIPDKNEFFKLYMENIYA